MSDQDRLDQLLIRWRELTKQGLRPAAAEICADCPELTDAFQRRLLGMENVAALLKIPATSSDEKALLAETSDGTNYWTGLRDALGPAADSDQAWDGATARTRLSFLDPPIEPGCLGCLGAYRVLEVLGEGGMGIVLKAEEAQPRRLVAIKVVRPEHATPQSRQRFLREGQALASVEHERIVPVYRVDEFRDVPFIVMPLLQGESLRARLKDENRLPLDEVLRIGREIAEGLAAAHSSGVIHRDIKPANIWLRGPEQRVVLLDFGLARPVFGQDEQGANLTSAGSGRLHGPRTSRGPGNRRTGRPVQPGMRAL